MISVTADIRSLLDELLVVLDKEIALLGLRRTQLESLSGAILDRDDGAVERLLVEIEGTQQQQSATDVKLQAIRNTLAGVVGLDTGEMKLARLVDELPPQERLALEYRRQQLIVLAEGLGKQHLETTMLLFESARINRMLLECLLPSCEAVETYGPAGMKGWRSDRGLVDTEL